ncbi:nuclear transport factor 2 family protein [Clostridium sp. P21]|uniref:Nuclear transport factor 2 family protein n=1 Tax=Clostridium muellerianum TaxID=2716538 RepID=A0A7Y0HM25_9CLOT|nr:nuclear transport factor 2 family protein [Clostridium muellerianum]NMM62564.1 nuclear transport factor 2 family protein [Clostridium muellerianum]
MDNFGVQYSNKPPRITFEKYNTLQKHNKEISEIKEVLCRLQAGYTKRDIEKIDDFVKELFIMKDDTCIIGTGTGELFLGIDQVKTLIKNDWEYWGDVNLDLENVHIDYKNEVAWVATTGTIRYTFEDTQEKYDNYLNFIKNKIENPEFTPKQKITFINWVLALTYHQRLEKKREYLWSLRLSGVLLKYDNKWKFSHIQFSMPKANFPDERFENSKEYLESYNKQNEIVDKYLDNQIDIEVKSLMISLEKELVGQKDISRELVNKYFVTENIPYIIGPDNQWCIGIDQIKEFFSVNNNSILSLDLEHAIASNQSGITWFTACGILKQNLTEDELSARVLGEIESLFQSDLTSKEKLFAIHRSVAYVLKESATGQDYTCPIRLTAVISKYMERLVFQQIHFSFPFYWIFEGKMDSF